MLDLGIISSSPATSIDKRGGEQLAEPQNTRKSVRPIEVEANDLPAAVKGVSGVGNRRVDEEGVTRIPR